MKAPLLMYYARPSKSILLLKVFFIFCYLNSLFIAAFNQLFVYIFVVFLTGEPASFQSELLAGIHFLKDRMQRSIAREDDSINRVANTIWSTAITIADLISAYFNF